MTNRKNRKPEPMAVACHEAGHAVARLALIEKRPGPVIDEVTIDQGGDILGMEKAALEKTQ